jgi:glycolate oxidase iron-sulfur subunit
MPIDAAHPPAAQELLRTLALEADRCVKCGLCLPECPTYRLTQDEAESPRGRIALIEGLAAGQIAAGTRVDRHLDNCLLCRRCERVCPSGVKYGELMDRARTLTRGERPAWLKLTAELLVRPTAVGPLLQLGRLAPRGGHLPGRFAALARAGDRATPPRPGSYAATGERRGRVGLFLGCVGRFSQARALHDALGLLRALGFDVEIPAQQTCCGALHAHLGEAERSRVLAERNNQAFDADLDAVVSIATGCGAHLADDPAYRHGLAERHLDLNTFLARLPLEDFRWEALPGRVLVHTPCSQVNALRSDGDVVRLLDLIPRLETAPLAGNTVCCGSAGSYLLSHPQTAERLREPKVEAAVAAAPDWLVTSNVGCALHLIEGLRAAGHPVPVLHPVQLLARQFRGAATVPQGTAQSV